MKFKPFEELFEIPIRNGLTKPKKVRGEGYKMINMGELFKFQRIKNINMDRVPLNDKEKVTSMVETGDLLFARQSLVRDGAGQCSIFLGDEEEVCFESHLIRCRLKKECANPLFYFYYFSSKHGKLAIDAIVEQGAGVSGIRGSDLAKILVPDIEKHYQDKVARIFDRLDKKIELNTEINQTLESIAQTIFKSWFIDFEPVKAKMSVMNSGGTVIEAEQAAMCVISGKDQEMLMNLQEQQPKNYSKLSSIAALFPYDIEDSEIGDIPKGWFTKPIKDFGNIICGKTPSKAKPEFFGQDTPFIKIPDMHNTMFAVTTVEGLSELGASSQANKTLPRGSICVSCIATVGRVIITTKESQTNQQINSIVPNNEYLTSYLYFYMLTLKKNFHDLASGGSATLNMNTSTFSNIKILRPNDQLLKIFNNKVQPLINRVESNLYENISLIDFRDTLLPKLLMGDMEV